MKLVDIGVAKDIVVDILSKYTEFPKSIRMLVRSAESERAMRDDVRGYVRSRSLGVVKFLNTIDYIVARALERRSFSEISQRDRSLLRLATYEGRWLNTSLEKIRTRLLGRASHLFETTRRVLELDLEAAVRRLKPINALSVKLSHPTFLVELLLENLRHDDALALMNHNNGLRNYYLRVNRLLEGHENVIKSLEKKDVRLTPEVGIPNLYKVVDCVDRLFSSSEFTSGQVLIQDKGSVEVVRALDPQPGMRIWDACAAPGMKTQLLWEFMNLEGQLDATDINPKRLEVAKRRCDSLGCQDVSFLMADAAEAPVRDADKILIDAPCSSTGMLRSHPSFKWRLNKQTLFSLMSIQNKILDGVLDAYADRPGTEIVYATCSLLPHEGESQIDSAMTRHSFELLEIPIDGSRGYDGFNCSEKAVRLFPHRHDSNAFFIARLRIID
ncbi:MAG: RsmB/NOP family class I SAM-dependent RNA methyltransferase [Candidatus Thorarchaeota archaeon]